MTAMSQKYPMRIEHRTRPGRQSGTCALRWALYCSLVLLGLVGCAPPPAMQEGIGDAIADLESDNVKTSDHAADRLVRIGTPCVVPLVLAVEATPELREPATHVLTRIGPPAIKPMLSATLEYPSSLDDFLSEVLKRIGKPGDAKSIAWLKQGTNPGRAVVIRYLGLHRRAGAVGLLCDLASKDTDARVRGEALWALGLIGDPRSRSMLVQALKEPERGIRHAAILAIAAMADRESVPQLLALLAKEKDASVREELATALGKLADKRAADIIMKELRSERTPVVRRQLLWALGRIKVASTTSYLQKIVRKDNLEERLEAAAGLVRMGNREALGILTKVARDRRESNDIRARATRLIGEVGGQDVIGLLGELLLDDEEFSLCPYYAARALASVADDTVVAAIETHLQDSPLYGTLSQFYCIMALARTKAPEAIKILSRVLSDLRRPPALRARAAHVLGELQDTTGQRALVEALEDRDSLIRETAAIALGKLEATKPSKTALRSALGDDVQVVREAARQALSLPKTPSGQDNDQR